MSDMPFNMPDASHSFEERGGWLAWRLLEVFDLHRFQGCGIVGNLGYESGGLKTLQEIEPAVPGSRGGYGWAQWTGPRRRAFEAWAAAHVLEPSSDEANYGFLIYELRRDFDKMLDRLRETTTIEQAVFLVGRDYEAPGGTTDTHLPGFTDRLSYARRALFGAGATTPAAQPRPDVIERILAAERFHDGVQAYQRSRGLRPDAVIGPLTLAALGKDMRKPR